MTTTGAQNPITGAEGDTTGAQKLREALQAVIDAHDAGMRELGERMRAANLTNVLVEGQAVIDTFAAIEQARQALATTEQAAPAVPQGEPVGVVYSFPSGDGNTAWGFKPNDSAWEVEKQPKSYERRFNVYLQAAPAAPSQPAVPPLLSDERVARFFGRLPENVNKYEARLVREIEQAVRAQFLTAPSQEPVTLTDGLIERGAMTGMVDVQIDAIVATLREKDGK